KPTKAEVFYFHEFFDAVVRTLTTKPRLFHAAKRRNFARDQPCVNAHHAAFKAFRRPPDAADIATIEVAREAKFGIVGHFDCLLIRLKSKQRRQRSKGLFFGDLHLRRNIRQYGWLKERLTERMPLAA